MSHLSFNSSSVWSFLSWEKCRKNIFRLQRRIFKSVQVGDMKKVLELQKLLLKSNSSRLLAIRYITQVSLGKKISGVDGKISLSFVERFSLSEYLLVNANNWNPKKLKKVLFSTKQGVSFILRVPTISDRAWCCLVEFAIEPAHQALFNYRSYKYGDIFFLHELQKILFLNLNNSSFGIQKRVLLLKFNKSFQTFNINRLLKKIIAPRSIKIGIFRLLKCGFLPSFEIDLSFGGNLNLLLANIILNGIEDLHNSLRYGDNILFFLKPNDNEKTILQNIKQFLSYLAVNDSIFEVTLHSSFNGFDFLGWHLKVYKNNFLCCTPSSEDYNIFLKRVKSIINNSNYGSKVKVAKLSPIIREWRNYHKFCNLSSSRFSLFLIKKRAFKVFLKESRQDIYSVKKLLVQSFLSSKLFVKEDLNSLYYGHFVLRGEYILHENKYFNNSTIIKSNFCIHCGMNNLNSI